MKHVMPVVAAFLLLISAVPGWGADTPAPSDPPAQAAPAAAPAEPTAAPPAAQAEQPAAMPSSHPALPGGEQSAPQTPPPAPKEVAISGKIVQTMKSGGYSFALVKTKKGDRLWVACPERELTVGEQVTFEPGMEMYNFESRTLKRTFDKIIFSNGPKQKTAAAAKDDKGKKPQRSPGSGGSMAVADEKIKVKKASGANAYTVAEIHQQKAKLNKKKVSVRGKVVKVSSGIMNRNWIHLQDGTGSHATVDNDLVITSDAIPSVGDVVLVKGTVIKDKDFGSGYKYSVMIEQAEIVIE